MTTDPPAPEMVHLIARVLANRPTPQAEVPAVVALIREAVANLGQASAAGGAERTPRAGRSPVVTRAPTPIRRRRGRPARAGGEAGGAIPAPARLPAPGLRRRAEVVGKAARPFLTELAPRGALRGIVKWFDPRTRRGALRLPGSSLDVPVEPQILKAARVARLYKGQEVEASVEGEGDALRLTRLSLPGGLGAGGPGARPEAAGRLAAQPRRSKPVVVELKHDSLRRVAARAEAELVLGRGRDR